MFFAINLFCENNKQDLWLILQALAEAAREVGLVF